MKARLLPFALALLTAAPACAEDAALIARALAAAGARDWAGAETAARASGPMALDLVLWQRLRAGQGSWAEYSGFAARHPDWPGMELLLRRGEAALREDLPAPEVLAWFGDRLPLTANGARAWIAAQPAAKRAEAAGRWWVQAAALDPRDEAAMLAAHGPALAPWHGARISALLDKGEWAAAEGMLTLIPAGPAADLARARIAVQARRPGVDALILALPEAQRADAGLALDRFRWRVAARQGDLARALMLERSTSAEALGNPAAWAAQRRDMARAALRAGDWALAERLAANHFLPAGDDAQDLDWLAGYGALRAGAADRAAAYFSRLPASGSGPITLSRTHYWRGRAAEAAGEAASARASYAEAARHQTAFYGQLAAERIGAPMQAGLALPGAAVDSLPDWRGAALGGNGVFQAGLWLVAAGDAAQAQRFFLHLAETAAPDDIARMARLMMELHRPWDALRLGKAAAAKGGVWPAIYFPLTGLERSDMGLPAELVLSIARRESEFNHTVSSPAGARGLMQVMPETARLMASAIAEPFEPARLTQDAAYNARLGAAYLRGLRDRFGHSVALVAAGYNAGPGRSARWLRDIGDLRLAGPEGVDPVDWVEMIPFDETRTYVMRVAEALPIYRARIAGHPVPLVPTWDLRGGLSEPPPPVSALVLALSDRPRPAVQWVRAAAAEARALALEKAHAAAGTGARTGAATGDAAQASGAASGGGGADGSAGAGKPPDAPAPAARAGTAAGGPEAGGVQADGAEADGPPIPAAQIAAVAAALVPATPVMAGPSFKPAARPGTRPPAGPSAGPPTSAAPAGSAAASPVGAPVSPAARPSSSATR